MQLRKKRKMRRHCGRVFATRGEMSTINKNNPAPLVCTLAAGELANRREEIMQKLLKQATDVREIDQGFEFIFLGEEALVSDLMEFIRFERNCCRFLSFDLAFEPEQGPVRLRILGTPDAKPIIRDLFAPTAV